MPSRVSIQNSRVRPRVAHTFGRKARAPESRSAPWVISLSAISAKLGCKRREVRAWRTTRAKADPIQIFEALDIKCRRGNFRRHSPGACVTNVIRAPGLLPCSHRISYGSGAEVSLAVRGRSSYHD